MTDVALEPFGDADPEDGWDAGDRIIDLLENIAVRVADLLDRDQPERERRVARLVIDIRFVQARLGDDDG